MLLFVYGSLLRGLHNHRCLRTEEPNGAKFVKEDSIFGALFSNAAYPFLVLPESERKFLDTPGCFSLQVQTTVKGEVYELESLEYCDRLESYVEGRPEENNLFNRRTVKTETGLDVYVYEGGKRFLDRMDEFPRVPMGDWKPYITSMKQLETQHAIEEDKDELQELLEDDNADTVTIKILKKIHASKKLTAKQIDTNFQRHVTKVQLIQGIKHLLNIVDSCSPFED